MRLLARFGLHFAFTNTPHHSLTTAHPFTAFDFTIADFAEMEFHCLLRSFRSLSITFARSQDGNLGLTLGLALVPTMIAIGIGIDYGRAAGARSAMQAAADSAAVMVAQEAAVLSSSERQEKALAYFHSLFSRDDVSIADIKVDYSFDQKSNAQSLKVDVWGSISNSLVSLSNLGGKKSTTIGTTSTVNWSYPRYRVTLALDNSSAMAAGSTLDELKKATAQLVEDFFSIAQTDADIHLAIVPFAQSVRIDPGLRQAAWLQWGGEDGWDNRAGKCRSSNGAIDSRFASRSACKARQLNWDATPRAQWNGCVIDRMPDEEESKAPAGPAGRGMPVWPQHDDKCPTAMLGMTSVRADKARLLNTIAAMSAAGSVNEPFGLSWAWLTHAAEHGPYPAPAKEPGKDYKDIIILVTAGATSGDRTTDDRQAAICDSIKRDNIRIVVVQLATDGAPASTAKACATAPDDPDFYSAIDQASDLPVQFKSIFRALTGPWVAG